MQNLLWLGAILLIASIGPACFAQNADPCKNAQSYSSHEPGLLADVPPLMVRRIFGRAIIEVEGRVISGDKVAPACLSLFTDASHQFVASAPVDTQGHFSFRGIRLGKYRLVARSPGLCTGNTRIEVTASNARKAENGILVHFRIRDADSCSYAGYDSKATRDTQ